MHSVRSCGGDNSNSVNIYHAAIVCKMLTIYVVHIRGGGRGGGEKILQLALSALKGTVSRDWDGFKLIPYWYSYYTKLKK